MLKKGLFLKRMAKFSAAEVRIKHPSKVIFRALPGQLHIVAELVSIVQFEKEFWTLFSITSEERKLCSQT